MNYAALTIGPVFEVITHTLNDKEKTRRLWAGSYFFSYFMRTLLARICTLEDITLLVPYAGEGNKKCTPFETDHNLGIFHDRFIAQSVLDEETLHQLIDDKINDTYEEIAQMIGAGKTYPLSDAMSNHLVVLSESELKKLHPNVILALNKLLDSQELQRRFVLPNGRINPIHAYQDNAARDIRLAGRDSNHPVRSTEELSGVRKDGTQQPGTVPYYAVILSDGDGMGKAIESRARDNPEGMVSISQNIYRFFRLENEEEEGTLFDFTNQRYGGELIYGGGDDVLALLPVKHDDFTFLNYLSDINRFFQEYLGEELSMSFGVAIVYYKYPLRDAIQTAQKLLYRAKNHGKAMGKPGAASIQMIKHSGQTHYSDQLLNDSDTYGAFKNLAESLLFGRVALPNAIHHSLERYRGAIVDHYAKNRGDLVPLFTTIFDDVRSDAELEGINRLREWIDAIKPASNREFQQMFGALALLKFLRGGSDE